MPRTPKRRVTLDKNRASELFIGGLCGCMQIADKLGLSASTGGAIVLALESALPKLALPGVIAAYRKIGGEMPPDLAAKVRAAIQIVSRETPRGTRRRKPARKPATPRRGRVKGR